MARSGLSTEVVVGTAATLADTDVDQPLTLTRVAQALEVKTPSLYNHVDGVEGLMRLVALDGIEQLGEACRSAAMGRAGSVGLRAVARAYREFALDHPGVYPLTQVARPDDSDYAERADRLLEPILALLAGLGIPDDDLIHAARSLRSALHGFVMLEVRNGFALDVDHDESFQWMLTAIEHGLAVSSEPRSA